MYLPIEVTERIRMRHPDASLAVIGCCAEGLNRDYCEVDVAAYPAVGRAWTLMVDKACYEVLPVADMSSLYREGGRMVVVRDERWSFSSLKASMKGRRGRLFHAMSLRRLTSAIKHLSIVYSSQASGRPHQATLNLLAAAARYSEATLLSRAVVPHPSHLLEQLKGLGALSPVATVLDFEQGTESSVKRRAERLAAGMGEAEGFVMRRKVEGLLKDLKGFDALLYLDWVLAERASAKDPRLELMASSFKLRLDEGELKRRADLLLSYVRAQSSQQHIIDDEG